MTVLFVALGTAAEACTRVRIHQYLGFLASRGVRATVEPFYPRPPRGGAPAGPPGAARRVAHLASEAIRVLRLARAARAHDVVVVQRVLPHPVLQRLLARACRRLVFDFDDAIYTTHAGAAAMPPRAAERFAHMLSLADAAVAATRVLAARAAPHCARVFVVPSAVDCERYRPRPRAGAAASAPFTVGWIGSTSTTMYLEPIVPVLARLRERHPEVRIRLVGARAGVAPGIAECPPWSLATELEHFASFDVGLMPLDDDEWARGKGGYKVLQYFACGVPAIASPVGAGAVLVDDGHTGFLASAPAEWADRLAQLVADRARARAMGAAARRVAEREHSLAVWAPRLLEVLEAVHRDERARLQGAGRSATRTHSSPDPGRTRA